MTCSRRSCATTRRTRATRIDLARTYLAFGNWRSTICTPAEAVPHLTAARDLLLPILKEFLPDHPIAVETSALLIDLGADYLLPRSVGHSALQACIDSPYATDPATLVVHGLNCLAAHDDAGYRRLCKRMAREDPTRKDDGRFSSDTALLCAMSATSGIPAAEFVALAKSGAGQSPPEGKQYRNIYAALAYYRAGDQAEALRRLEVSEAAARKESKNTDQVRLVGEDTAGLALRALLLQKSGPPDRARQALDAARRSHAELERSFLIRNLNSAGFPNLIFLQITRQLLSELNEKTGSGTFPTGHWHACYLAWCEIKFSRPDRARAELDAPGPVDPKDADLLAAYGYLRRLAGDTERGRADRDAALKLRPDHPLARFDRGSATIADRPEQAAADLVLVIQKLPDLRSEEMADRLIMDKLLATSDRAFQRAIELRPGDQQLWACRARYLAWNSRWKEASQAYLRTIEGHSVFVNWLECASALVLADDVPGYRTLCGKAADDLKKPHQEVEGYWGDLGRFDLASRMARLHPDSGIDPQTVVAWAVRATGGYPDDAITNGFPRAGAANFAKNFKKAIPLATSTLKYDPLWYGREMNYYELAIAHAGLGRRDDAQYWFNLAEAWRNSKFDPKHAPSLNDLTMYTVNDFLEDEVLRRKARALLDRESGGRHERR